MYIFAFQTEAKIGLSTFRLRAAEFSKKEGIELLERKVYYSFRFSFVGFVSSFASKV